MRIAYDTTYCFRGNTGIPYDAKKLATVIAQQDDKVFLVFPKNSLSYGRSNWRRSVSDLGNAIRSEQGKTIIPSKFRLLIDFFFSIIQRRNIKFYSPRFPLNDNIFKNLISTSEQKEIYISKISSDRRWARTVLRKPFRISRSVCDIYVQQHIEPISLAKGIKGIVRIHDLIPVTHPQYFDDQAVRLFLRGLKTLLSQGERITWVFDTKANALEFTNLFKPKGKVLSIPCAIDDDALKMELLPNPSSQKYFVMVGTLEPRKNHNLTMSVFESIIKSSTERSLKKWKLVILGKVGWQSREIVHQVSRLEKEGLVIFIDNPTRDEILGVISQSRFLIYPSSVEGFGLPPLEALALGKPVLVSDIPQNRENLGGQANYFQLGSTKSLEMSMRKMFSLPDTEYSLNKLRSRREFVSNRYSSSVFKDNWTNLLESLRDI